MSEHSHIFKRPCFHLHFCVICYCYCYCYCFDLHFWSTLLLPTTVSSVRGFAQTGSTLEATTLRFTAFWKQRRPDKSKYIRKPPDKSKYIAKTGKLLWNGWFRVHFLLPIYGSLIHLGEQLLFVLNPLFSLSEKKRLPIPSHKYLLSLKLCLINLCPAMGGTHARCVLNCTLGQVYPPTPFSHFETWIISCRVLPPIQSHLFFVEYFVAENEFVWANKQMFNHVLLRPGHSTEEEE